MCISEVAAFSLSFSRRARLRRRAAIFPKESRIPYINFHEMRRSFASSCAGRSWFGKGLPYVNVSPSKSASGSPGTQYHMVERGETLGLGSRGYWHRHAQ